MKYLKETLKWSGYKNKIGHSIKKELFDSGDRAQKMVH